MESFLGLIPLIHYNKKRQIDTEKLQCIFNHSGTDNTDSSRKSSLLFLLCFIFPGQQTDDSWVRARDWLKAGKTVTVWSREKRQSNWFGEWNTLRVYTLVQYNNTMTKMWEWKRKIIVTQLRVFTLPDTAPSVSGALFTAQPFPADWSTRYTRTEWAWGVLLMKQLASSHNSRQTIITSDSRFPFFIATSVNQQQLSRGSRWIFQRNLIDYWPLSQLEIY